VYIEHTVERIYAIKVDFSLFSHTNPLSKALYIF